MLDFNFNDALFRGPKQKDLAIMLNKNEPEISKWIRGTHNFTLDPIRAIENTLEVEILQLTPA